MPAAMPAAPAVMMMGLILREKSFERIRGKRSRLAGELVYLLVFCIRTSALKPGVAAVEAEWAHTHARTVR